MNRQSRPLVTIAIPTYNRADGYLRTALESALNQTYDRVEVLVVDNCSTDNTPDVIRAYERKHSHLRYIRHAENIGAVPNFQYCLEAAQGDFFLMLHDDDSIDTDFLATCLEAANYDTQIGYIRTGTRQIDSAGAIVKEYPNKAGGLQREAHVLSWLRGEVFWYFSSSLLNTEAFRSTGGFEEGNPFADLTGFARLALRRDGVNVKAVKASYREHEARLTDQMQIRTITEEYAYVRNMLVTESSPHWKESIEEQANEFCALLLCSLADQIPDKLNRLRAYVLVGREFGVRHIPRPLSKLIRLLLPPSLEASLDQAIDRLRGRDAQKQIVTTGEPGV